MPPADLVALRAARRSAANARRATRSFPNLGSPEASVRQTKLLCPRAMRPHRACRRPVLRPGCRLPRSRPASPRRRGRRDERAGGLRPRPAGRSSRRRRCAASAAAGRSRAPAVRSGSGCSRRARICSGDSTVTRTAASSMARGRASRRTHISATAGAFMFVTAKSARTARARSMNSSTACTARAARAAAAAPGREGPAAERRTPARRRGGAGSG